MTDADENDRSSCPAALTPASTLAQEGSAEPQPPSPLRPELPLAAMRHQPPREDTVYEREIAREGQQELDQQSKQEQTEID